MPSSASMPLDRAGAAEAYRKALETAPDDVSTRWELGNLLTRDEHGLRYANPEYVDAAIVELTAAYEKHKDETLLKTEVMKNEFRQRMDSLKDTEVNKMRQQQEKFNSAIGSASQDAPKS